MPDDRWNQVSRIYYEAAVRHGAERAAYLTAACAGDQSLREEIESLLAAPSSELSVLLQQPSIAVAAPLITTDVERSLIGRRLGVYEVQTWLAPAAWATCTAHTTRDWDATSR